MTSTFSWLDHSDRERQRMLDAIDRFTEKDTRDELGLGSVRDGLSDLFFPGTNTIQTRARYFLFVPWIYRSLEAVRGGSDNVAARARRQELALCEALCRSEDDQEGVIGARARGSLKRLPSNIYWLGLGVWGIRRFPGSQDDYHQRLKRRDLSQPLLDDDDDVVEGSGSVSWHSGLPEAPKDLLKAADLRLTRDEAVYLRERIQQTQGDSLLSHLVKSRLPMSGDFPWCHPAVASLSADLRQKLEHARLFSETMHGAALLYNLMLSEEQRSGDGRDERLETLRADLSRWCEDLGERARAIAEWDQRAFWKLAKDSANVRPSTERFVEDWWRLRPWAERRAALDSPVVRDLIRAREAALKRGRARLGNQSVLEAWNGAAGLARLSYRWAVTTRMVNDIHAGLGLGGRDARSA